VVGNNCFLNFLVFNFYKIILMPTISGALKLRFNKLIKIEQRNSSKDLHSFNFLLSDIDTTVLVKDHAESEAIIKTFMSLRKILIMLDIPEIYTQTEFSKLKELKRAETWSLVDLMWSIRKINWCKLSLEKNKSELNKLKMNRAIKNNLKKIVKTNVDINKKQYYLDDFILFDQLFDVSRKNIFISCYSEFLANNNNLGISIELSKIQFLYFNYLFPGDHTMDNEIQFYPQREQLLKCKLALTDFEKLLIKSKIRLFQALGEIPVGHIQFLAQLESGKELSFN
jgi:hypothetical protein